VAALEADPTVQAFCERPAYVEGGAGRVLDFWVDQGGHAKFWALSSEDSESLPKTAHGVTLRVLRRPDMVAFAMRIKKKWGADRAVSDQLRPAFGRPASERHMRSLGEAAPPRANRSAFHPIDDSVVRAALFDHSIA
jgi:hypothetical protein